MQGNEHNRLTTYAWRSAVVTALFVVGAVLMLARAFELQVMRKDFLQDQGQARHVRVVEMPAHRGMITDRNGEPLAVSTPVASVWVNPRELGEAASRLPEIADVLEEDARKLVETVAERQDREFVYLKRHITPQIADEIEALAIPGVYLQREYKRFYPAAEVTAHLLGFTNIDDHGQEGLELAFNEWLSGEAGAKRVLRNRLGQTVEDLELLSTPHPGKVLRTSIDLRLQYLAYRELKSAIQENDAISGSIVVLDATTGEVLALANQPSFNPNNRSELQGGNHRNRALTDVFEPGSSFKPFPIIAALETGEWHPSTTVDTSPGFIKVGGYTIPDKRNYGVIDVTTVLAQSVNVGASKIALSLERDHLWSVLARFGFGSVTGSGVPGETGGVLPHWQRWRDVTQATLSYGYGLSVTPLQLAQAYGIIAADGISRPVSFVAGNSTAGEQVIQPRSARSMRYMLETVVAPNGTGSAAIVNGYRVAGKTGTARKAVAGGYATDRHIAVFAGMAPVENPRLVTVVVINEPRKQKYYGGAIAAPVFSRVMAGGLRLLNVAPDAAPAELDRGVIIAERTAP
ncbi:MAG: penicillin-binding protein 2 [Proteobacteria bacterium]|nr:penicillin-binding protein 2 [Pseudomonadota bacterium]